MADIKKIVGNNVKMYREEKDMNQWDLAWRAGFQSSGSVSTIEAGDIDIKITRLAKIAKVLDVKVIDLIWEDEENV